MPFCPCISHVAFLFSIFTFSTFIIRLFLFYSYERIFVFLSWDVLFVILHCTCSVLCLWPFLILVYSSNFVASVCSSHPSISFSVDLHTCFTHSPYECCSCPTLLVSLISSTIFCFMSHIVHIKIYGSLIFNLWTVVMGSVTYGTEYFFFK